MGHIKEPKGVDFLFKSTFNRRGKKRNQRVY